MIVRDGLRRGIAAALFGTALAWTPAALSTGKNLDRYDNATLRKALEAEISEMFTRGGLKRNQRYPIDVLYEKIIEALGDDGDAEDDDPDDDLIDWDDLEAEMAELQTTVEDEVWDVLEQLVAEQRQGPSSPYMLVADVYAQAGRSNTRPAGAGPAATAVVGRLLGDIGKVKR